MSELQTDIENSARLLSRPSETPSEFGSWIVYWLVQNIDISTYQLRGLADTFFRAAPGVAADESTASGSMTNLATVGPTLSGLENGVYLAFWGANFRTTGSDAVGLMGMSPNGAGASDAEAAKGRTLDDSDNVPIVYSRRFELLSNDQNYLQARYMKVAGGNPSFWNRWLAAVKVEKR